MNKNCPIIIFLIFIIFIVPPVFLNVNLARGQWSPPVRISEPGGILYPQILAQGDTLHVVFTTHGGPEPYRNIGYLRSSDAGVTWTSEIELSDTTYRGLALYPRIMALGSRLMVAYLPDLYPSFRRYNIAYCLSHDGGRNWTEVNYIFARNWDLMGHVTAASFDSTINVIFGAEIDTEVAYYTIFSTDFGATWSDTLRLFEVEESNTPDQAADNGMIHYAWGGRFDLGMSYEVHYTRSTDGGLSWSENVTLSDIDDHPSQLPSLAVDGFGNPAIGWFDFKYSPYMFTGDILARWSYDGGESWLAENQVTYDHYATVSDMAWIADTIHVVWHDSRFGSNRTIYYTCADDSIGSWSPEQRLEDDPYNSAMPALAVSNGKVYVVWYDERENGGVYFTRYPAFPDAVDEEEIPGNFEGLQAYPNPFNSNTLITYSFTETKEGRLEIYNVEGRKIRTYNLMGKKGQIEWDARDFGGNKVSSGIYFARVKAAPQSYTIRLLYVK
jgi:hypothetical protein